MAYSNGIITKPISIDDIKIALGVWDNSISALCKSPQINMWSRYKPVINPAPFSSNDGAGFDGKYGIIPFLFSDLSIIDRYYGLNDRNGWQHNAPTGGATAPYRFEDFAGYKADATPPFNGIVVSGGCKDISDYITITGNIRSALTENEISISEIEGVADKYFGVAVTNLSNVAKGCITSAGTITASGINLQFNIAGLSEGSYIVYPFLAAAPINPQSPGNSHTGSYYTIPQCSPISLSVYNAYLVSDFKAIISDGNITASFVIANKTDSDLDFSPFTLKLRYRGKEYNEVMLADEQTLTISGSAWIVPAHSSKTISSKSFTAISDNLLVNCQMYMSFSIYGRQRIYSTIPTDGGAI